MKLDWKPGTMIYPLPALLVSCGDIDKNNSNIITVSWVGTVCTDPPMCYVSIRKSRHSYDIIRESGEFALNLTTKAMARETDFCGVTSGEKTDKFKECRFTKDRGLCIKSPLIKESPVNIECKISRILELGSHDMFIANVVNVRVDDKYINKDTGALDLYASDMLAYCHGEYFNLGEFVGYFGWSVKKGDKTIKRRK